MSNVDKVPTNIENKSISTTTKHQTKLEVNTTLIFCCCFRHRHRSRCCTLLSLSQIYVIEIQLQNTNCCGIKKEMIEIDFDIE